MRIVCKPGPTSEGECLREATQTWNRARWHRKANDTVSSHWHKQVLRAETGSQERGRRCKSSLEACPEAGEEELQAPGQHIHLSLVSPRVIHCQWESLSLGGLSLCDSRTGDRTGWLGRRAGHGLRGQAAWATPAPPLRGGPGLGLSCYSRKMEVVPPPLQDRGEDEEQMEISPHGSWRVTSGAERGPRLPRRAGLTRSPRRPCSSAARRPAARRPWL